MSAAHSTRERAVCYYRCSDDKQEASIPRQRDQVIPYAQRQGYEVIAHEEDDGIRGHEFEKRPGFMRVMALAKAGKVDVIVVDEMSRLSRANVIEFITTVVSPLQAAG